VLGSQPEHYEVDLDIDKSGEVTDSDCSCPVGYACKHVAAVGLKALVELSRKPSLAKQSQSQTPLLWAPALTKLIDGQREQSAIPFQLQLLLSFEKDWRYGQDMIKQTYLQRFGGRRQTRTMPRQSSDPLWNVTLRPRLFNPATNHFSISKIKWSDASYNSTIYWDYVEGKLSEMQHAYLQLLTAGINRYGNGWEQIRDDMARFIWKLLGEHADYGVTLLGGEKGQYPIVISQTPLIVGLRIDETEVGVSLGRQ